MKTFGQTFTKQGKTNTKTQFGKQTYQGTGVFGFQPTPFICHTQKVPILYSSGIPATFLAGGSG